MNLTTAEDTLLTQAKQAAADDLLKPDSFYNVLAVGVEKGPPDCIRVYVQKELAPGVNQIKKDYLGVKTCVIEIGRFGRLNRGPEQRTDIGPGFPIRFDTTASNVNPLACGTLGATVQYGESYYILSCNHILAVNGRVPKGTKIVSAELVGAGVKPKEIATFQGDFVPIGPDAIGSADCALAQLGSNFRPEGFSEFAPIDLSINMPVKKDGAITGVTSGVIVDTAADVSVDYSFGTFRFNDQILIGGGKNEFAWDGDSGSIVTDMQGHPLAMVFAEAGQYAVACPLSTVFKEFEKLPTFKEKKPLVSLEKLASY